MDDQGYIFDYVEYNLRAGSVVEVCRKGDLIIHRVVESSLDIDANKPMIEAACSWFHFDEARLPDPEDEYCGVCFPEPFYIAFKTLDGKIAKEYHHYG